MSRDLVADPPPAEWARAVPARPLELAGCETVTEQLVECWRSAYPLGHPDHYPGSDRHAVAEHLSPLLAGRLHGPTLPGTAVVRDPSGDVIGCVVVNRVTGEPPWGGPWITELFRRPGAAFAGVGAVLLRRAMAATARAGVNTIGLFVSEGNPAYRLYRRHGFVVLDHVRTVIVPP